MSAELFYSLHFRPVGQGLFTHGNLQFESANKHATANFEWVYDCGAEKLGAHLQGQIAAYGVHNPGNIDLLMISHFDKDHVVGIRELLAKRKPKLIVVPYLSLAARLEAIAALGPNDTEYAGFLAAPAAALRQFAGENARIVFILPGGEPPPNQSEGDGTDPNQPWPLDTRLRDRERSSPGHSGTFHDPEFDTDQNAYGVYRVDGSRPLIVRNRWEFCFYNRPRPEMEAPLLTLVKPVLDEFVASSKRGSDYAELIYQLREAFEVARGPGSRPKRFDANEISLVVYSGPVKRDTNESVRDTIPWTVPANIPPEATRITRTYWPPPCSLENERCGILFTGDITLDDSTYAGINTHFGHSRLDFVAYFQVPHHGSKHSYRLSRSVGFLPDYSIFSSARYHPTYDHPSDVVIESLGECGPLFVNEYQGLTTGGFLQ